MKDKIGEIYAGLVVNISNNKITIELDDIPIKGYIPLTDLGDDYNRFSSFFMELVGKKTSKVIRFLDKAVVRVDRIDYDAILSLMKLKSAAKPNPDEPASCFCNKLILVWVFKIFCQKKPCPPLSRGQALANAGNEYYQ